VWRVAQTVADGGAATVGPGGAATVGSGGAATVGSGGAATVGSGAAGEASGSPDRAGARLVEFERSRGIDLTFAPRTTTVLDLALETPGKPMWDRPDVGIGADDVRRVSARTIRVTVHSLGSVPAPPSTVTLVDAAGHEVAHAQAPAIPAPLDLMPKTAQVTLQLPSAARTSGAKVRVRLIGDVQEITQLNNEVVLP
jgi:hypothetical protein